MIANFQEEKSGGVMVNIPEWKNTTLGNEVDFLTGFPFKSDQYLTDISQPKLLRGDNIVQGHLRWDNSKHWHKDKIAGLELYLLQQNDVVLAMDRPWIEAGLKFSSITENDIPSLLVQRVSRLRGTETILSRFIKYIIGDKGFTDYILSIQTGTAVPLCWLLRTSVRENREQANLCSRERQEMLRRAGRKTTSSPSIQKETRGRQAATGILRWLSHFIHISSSSLPQMPSAVYAAL